MAASAGDRFLRARRHRGAPSLPHLSSAQCERPEQLADAARLRTALFPSPKPLPAPRAAPGSPPGGRLGPYYDRKMAQGKHHTQPSSAWRDDGPASSSRWSATAPSTNPKPHGQLDQSIEGPRLSGCLSYRVFVWSVPWFAGTGPFNRFTLLWLPRPSLPGVGLALLKGKEPACGSSAAVRTEERGVIMDLAVPQLLLDLPSRLHPHEDRASSTSGRGYREQA